MSANFSISNEKANLHLSHNINFFFYIHTPIMNVALNSIISKLHRFKLFFNCSSSMQVAISAADGLIRVSASLWVTPANSIQ